MALRKKALYRDNEPRRYDNIMADGLSCLGSKINEWISNQSAGVHLLLAGILFSALFMLFRSINRGHVEIAADGTNVVNMAALLMIDLFLQMIWMAYNGDETQGFGGM